MQTLAEVLEAIKADAIRAAQGPALSDQEREMVRQRIYFPLIVGDAPVRLECCRTAISGLGLRQCDRTPKVYRGSWCLCLDHARGVGSTTVLPERRQVMRRPYMHRIDSDEAAEKAFKLANTPRVQQAIAKVHRAANSALRVEARFRWWLVATGAAALRLEQVPFAGRLYVRLGRYQARRILKGDSEARELRLLLQALWEFLEAHEALPEMLHQQEPEGWGSAAVGEHLEVKA